MRWRRPLVWMLVSLLCFVGAVLCWKQGEQRRAERAAASRDQSQASETNVPAASSTATNSSSLLTQSGDLVAAASVNEPVVDEKFPLRLRNTRASLNELAKNDAAILLENALLDTSRPMVMRIPPHLRASGDHGTYVVQARGPLNDVFRGVLRRAGATIVSYIPNNAYLVRVKSDGADRLARHPLARAVIPFEPYYKLRGETLELAVEQKPLPEDSLLDLVAYPDSQPELLEDVHSLGGVVVSEDRSPFGAILTVQVPLDALASVASLSSVQLVGIHKKRISANDLSRVRLGTAPDPFDPTNYLGLTGEGVIVSVNDSGVDATHPDLQGRVQGDSSFALQDTEGHGTHIAATIAGTGLESTNINMTPYGSLDGASFRGHAPAAQVYSVVAFSETGHASSDSWLQEAPARTNALISNNSWNRINDPEYDIAAASYDAAVRDALPEDPGSSPVLFVFSAGNAGTGGDDGLSGLPENILSPATAKNVLTVGAIEQPRDVTNEVVICESEDQGGNCVTNTPFAEKTDSDFEVAGYSSRGNVGIGLEGEGGRFKPDLVAPGSFVISARSSQWDTNAYYFPNIRDTNTIPDQYVVPDTLWNGAMYIPADATEFKIFVTEGESNDGALPDVPIYVRRDQFPTETEYDLLRFNSVSIPPDTTLSPVDSVWFYAVGNPTNVPLFFDITTVLTTTNNDPVFTEGMRAINDEIAPSYRYESGTSMAAANISGMLALIQEFFETKLRQTVSPALLKAMLINGSRSTAPIYDFNVNALVNHQGWGIPYLTNVITAETNFNAEAGSSIFVYDQSATNALATGEEITRMVRVQEGAGNQPLRFTLVWTDPPGNPAASFKLVNNLDLIVTNLDSGEVYTGNAIQAGSDFSTPWDTNVVIQFDSVNNVENVFISPILDENYSVTVKARRVNVNALPDHPDNTVQDYALVISCGDGDFPEALQVLTEQRLPSPGPEVTLAATTIEGSNTVSSLLQNQFAGEHTPLLGTTNGIAEQWHFYALTNTSTFTNAAFVTFLPSTLSLPRMGVFEQDPLDATRPEADIDLYVTLDPALTNLNEAAVNNATKSLGRGGTEIVTLTNSRPGDVYYIGVKSEDHEAALYTLFATFSLLPFGTGEEGDLVLQGVPVPTVIEDGSPAKPGAGLVLGIATEPIDIRRVVVTNTMVHENFGDLIGNLSHGNNFAVLNNHTYPPVEPAPLAYTYIYEDNGEEAYFGGDAVSLRPSDGPGSLRNFVGEDGIGLWLMTMVDNSLSQTGFIDNLQIRLERSITNGVVTERTIRPNSWYYDVVDVPPDATNLTVCVEIVSSTPLPLDLFIRQGDFPSEQLYDYFKILNPPGDCLSVSTYDLPPLQPGNYYFGIHNPNDLPQDVRILVTIQTDVDGRDKAKFTSGEQIRIQDDAVTYASQVVTDKRKIADMEVGLRVEHPRVSDLAVTLVSPEGTRVLLVENRGMDTPDGFGGGITTTNFLGTQRAGAAEANTNTIPAGANEGTLIVDYNFLQIPDRLVVLYDDAIIYDSDYVNGTNVVYIDFGPGASTDLTLIMNPGDNPDSSTKWSYTPAVVTTTFNYLAFTEDEDKADTAIKFGVPPFRNEGVPTNIVDSGFERPTVPRDYPAGDTVDGWDVLTNQVTVVDDPAVAHSGDQFLALSDGEIGQVLSTTVGSDYIVSYALRGPDAVSWWRGEGEATDWVDGNDGVMAGAGFQPGLVGEAFSFDGSIARVIVPPAANLQFTNALTIEGWVKPSVVGDQQREILSKWEGGAPLGQASYRIGIDTNGFGVLSVSADGSFTNTASVVSADPIPVDSWTHVAGVYDGSELRFYLNGRLSNTEPWTNGVFAGTAPVIIGSTASSGAFFAGLVDELTIYGRAVSAAELDAIVRAGSQGKFDVEAPTITDSLSQVQMAIGGVVTNTLRGLNGGWVRGTYRFTARTNEIPLVFTGLLPGTLLDTIKVRELPGDEYYFPETLLDPLVGENAQGEWRLEIADKRAGGLDFDPLLISWQLRFIYETVRQTPIPVQPGLSVTNTIPANSILYFTVDVPGWASFATNILESATDPVTVWFDQTLPPTGTNVDDLILIGPDVTSGTNTLTTNGIPPLMPGERYYVGIANDKAAEVTTVYRVDFDIATLTNGIPVTSSLGIEGVRYFQYDMSTNATAAQFELLSLSGNADLVLNYLGPLPTVGDHDYGSFNPGTTDEQILVLTNSDPVPLAPGRWYVGVLRADLPPVDYTVLVTEFTNDFPEIITLENGIPYPNSNDGVAQLEDYYRYVVSGAGARAQFDILNPTADVTLVVRKGLPPADLSNYDYWSANVNTNDEMIVIYTNSAPVALSPGNWFVSAVNNSGGPVSYTIKATEWPTTGLPLDMQGEVVDGRFFCITWNSLVGARYVVQGRQSFSQPGWEDISSTITAADVQTTFCVPLPSQYSFFRVVEGLVLSDYVPPVFIDSIDVDTNGVTLTWFAPLTYAFEVQWKPALTAPNWTSFTNRVTATGPVFRFLDDGSQTGGLDPLRYYRLQAFP